MTDADVLDVTVDMIWCIIKCSAPLLLVSLIVGLVISIFQTVTNFCSETIGNIHYNAYMWWMDYEQLRGTFYKTV